MEIKASSKYDWETIKKFNNFHNLKRRNVFNVLILIMEIFMVAVFVFSAASGIFTTDLLPSFSLFLLWNAVIIFLYFGLPKIQYNKNKFVHGVSNEITFCDDLMMIEQNGTNTNSSATVKYDAVWNIYETKEYIYIYVNSRQAYIIDKSTITGGTATDLRIFLVKAVGMSKYKVKCKV